MDAAGQSKARSGEARSAAPRTRTAIVLIGSRVTGSTPGAVWLTAAGWAEAARRRFGRVIMITATGAIDPAEARTAATTSQPASGPPTTGRRRLLTARTAAKDVRDLGRALVFARHASQSVPRGTDAAMVWQHHEPWQWSGWLLARRCRVPWVLFVDAPVVWESRAWGVRRPGWGRLLERLGEVPQLRRADVVACVSTAVAQEVRRLGAPAERVVVTPCSADPEVFTRTPPGASQLRQDLGLEQRVVVGWLGSFRRFHGIELLLEAYATAREDHPELALLLVGDGSERRNVEEDIRSRGLPGVVFTGMVTHDQVPRHLAVMDIGVVVDPGASQWHYSPLKLQEYMASGLAVVAPRSGQVPTTVRDHREGLLVPPNDARALAACLLELARDPQLRDRLGTAARARSEASGGWERQLDQIMARVNRRE